MNWWIAVVLSTILKMSTIYTEQNDKYKLLPILKRSVSENIHSYEIIQHIPQANAEGFDLMAYPTRKDSDLKESGLAGEMEDTYNIFIKRVEAHKYAHKSFSDLRRTLLYARTEARFYSEILPLLLSSDDRNERLTPKVYLAETSLEGLIDEHESASAKLEGSDPVYDENNTKVLQNRGGLLVMDSVSMLCDATKSSLRFFQDSPLSITQAKLALRAIANFHALGFENHAILSKVSASLCEYGGSYHLKNRNPKELEEIEKTWNSLMNELKQSSRTPSGFFERSSIKNLGRRVKESAAYVSTKLSPTPTDKFATIVHGDYKAMNVFLPHLESKEKAILIDFASTGVGLGVSDVAMHIIHALHPKDLQDGADVELFMYYYQAFNESLPDERKSSYAYNDALKHYKYAVVDYFRFVLGRLWRGATLTRFEKNKESKNAVFVNRNVDAALHFIELTDQYLKEIEKEMLLVDVN